MSCSYKTDFETDVLVVGYGNAGSVAAIAAFDAGAKVIVLEKLNQGGGATRLSSGGIFIPGSMAFANYLYDIALGRTPQDVLETFVKDGIELEGYFKSIGVSISHWGGNNQEVSVSYPPLGRPSWPKVRDGNMIRVHATAADEKPVDPEVWKKMTNNEKVYAIGRTYGIDLWEQLKARTEERGIPTHYNTRAKELIQNKNGEVTGVIAEKDGKQVVYKAKRGVIMTTGGFAGNEKMMEAYLACPFVYLGTSDYCTGDGHIMCQKAGARNWHMNAVCGQVGFKAPEIEQAFQPRAVSEAFVWVDKFGARYTNETTEKLHNAWRKVSLFDPENNLTDGKEWPRIPMYMVFDETMRKNAPISRDWRTNRDYTWSLDNSEEIKKGWIKKGDTLEELAQVTGMDSAVLKETIANFNKYCEEGKDLEFGRDPKTMKPINNGPYYALPLVPALISTQGGPEHDRESRVLDNDGKPIPHLFAAGELSSIIGWLYEAGTGHAESTVFARIAGENAAKETPLE
jgi:succinate dehydrogenase/fumarate reductase flavoprotein subunit